MRAFLTIVALGILVLTFSFALIPASYGFTATETYVLDIGPTNTSCGFEDNFMLLNPSTAPPQSSPGLALPEVDFCSSVAYSGPLLTVTSVVITLFGTDRFCGGTCAVSGSMSCAGCGPTVYTFPSEATTFPGALSSKCTDAGSMVIVPLGPFGVLNPGNFILATFSFTTGILNEYPLICTGASLFGSNTESQIVITGTAQTPVPEFPLGFFAIIAIGIPALVLLRSRLSQKL